MSMTLLRASKPLSLAKVWQEDGSILPAAQAKWLEALAVPFETVSDILEVIQLTERWPRVAMVKEAIAEGADPKRLRRRCEGGTDIRTGKAYPAGLRVLPRNWVPVDVDKLQRPPSIDWRDGQRLASYARGLLPREFQNAAAVWQLSGSSGHPTKRDEIRLHFFFKLDDAVLPKAWKPTFAHLPFIDAGFFDNARLIFTASPIIKSGADPLGQRHGLLDGEPCVRVPQDALKRSDEIANAHGGAKSIAVPVVSAPMPGAAGAFVAMVARSNILRSQHIAYCNQRNRRLAFCTLLRESFGIQDDATLEDAFFKACVGEGDPKGSHDAQQALAWTRSPRMTGHRFSSRKLLSDASAALHAAGESDTAAQAARLAMVLSKIESRGGRA